MNFLRPSAALFLASLFAPPAGAQVPGTLRYAIPAPFGSVQTGARFGTSVAVDGGFMAVGAPRDDIKRPDAGLVKVFNAATGAPLFLIHNPGPSDGDHFGEVLAMSGTRLVAGSPSDYMGSNFPSGAVYVYDLSSSTPGVPLFVLNNPAPSSDVGNRFATSVGISGTRVVISGYYSSIGASRSGVVYVYDLAGAAPTVPVRVITNPTPAVEDYFGYSVAVSGSLMVAGAYQDDTGGTNAGIAYVYDLAGETPGVPLYTLNNPTPEAHDVFGWSVGIYNTRVVVGARLDNTGATGAGSVYVYDLAGETPLIPVTTLNNPEPFLTDNFGAAVAVSGPRVVVGAYQDDSGADNAGSAYVFNVSGATPTVPVATLRNPEPGVNDYFGYTVAISGTKVAAGAYLDDMGAPDAGSACLFDVSRSTPAVPVAVLNEPGPAAGGAFGTSVAVDGSRVVAGAPRVDAGAIDAGIAYVYDLTSATPTVPVFTLLNPGPTAEDYFGSAVDISGPLVVVGAHQDDAGGYQSGSAWVYDLNSATPGVPWLKFVNPISNPSDFFGEAVAISGTKAVVGADEDDVLGLNSGVAFLYDLTGAQPEVPAITFYNPTPGSDDRFGCSVAIDGDLLVIGAYGDRTPTMITAGAAYVYDLTKPNPEFSPLILKNPEPGMYDNFGSCVAISGTRVAIAAPSDSTGATYTGTVYVYDLSSETPEVPVARFLNPRPSQMDYFGLQVAISDRLVVAASPNEDHPLYDTGMGYLFDLNGSTPLLPAVSYLNPSPAGEDYFATGAAIDGTTVVFGAPSDDTSMPDKGSIYIFGPAAADADSDGLLDSWERTYWPTVEGHSAQDDFDHDGYSELLELALGLNPMVGDAGGLPAATVTGGYLTLTVNRRPGVSYQVQSAGTLQTDQPGSFSASSTTVLTDNATTLTVRDNVLYGAAPARFIRLQVTAAP